MRYIGHPAKTEVVGLDLSKKPTGNPTFFFEPARRSGTGEKIQVGFGPGIEDRDEHGHLSSLVGLALHRALSAQFLNVLEAFVRPDAHAGWLGRLEGLAEPVANKLGGHALTRVADLDARLPTQSVDAEPDLAGRIGRIERVLNDVSDDSFQAFFVTSRSDGFAHVHVHPAAAPQRHGFDPADDAGEIDAEGRARRRRAFA